MQEIWAETKEVEAGIGAPKIPIQGHGFHPAGHREPPEGRHALSEAHCRSWSREAGAQETREDTAAVAQVKTDKDCCMAAASQRRRISEKCVRVSVQLLVSDPEGARGLRSPGRRLLASDTSPAGSYTQQL